MDFDPHPELLLFSDIDCIETNNRRQVENVGSEQKSKKVKKGLEKLMKRYPNIGKNEYFISRWGYTLEFNEVK